MCVPDKGRHFFLSHIIGRITLFFIAKYLCPIIDKQIKTIPMKIYIWTLIITNFLILSIVDKTSIQQSETNMLFNTWFLDTYKMDSKDYPPNKREKDDYILFKEDMTYTSKSEGKEEKGTFILNVNGAYVLMIDQNGEKIKAYIISISKRALVLKYDINEISDVEVHYNNPI